MKKKDFLRLLGKEEPFFVVEGKNPNYATNSCSFMTRMYIHGELERKVRFDLVLASPYSWCRILSGSSYGKCFKTILLKYNRGRWDKYDVVCTIFPKREDYEGEYLYLVGLMVKKKYRGTGIATKIIKDIFKHADENGYRVRAWACNVFGTDLRTWIPFLEKVGFQRVDNENNLIYYPKSSS